MFHWELGTEFGIDYHLLGAQSNAEVWANGSFQPKLLLPRKLFPIVPFLYTNRLGRPSVVLAGGALETFCSQSAENSMSSLSIKDYDFFVVLPDSIVDREKATLDLIQEIVSCFELFALHNDEPEPLVYVFPHVTNIGDKVQIVHRAYKRPSQVVHGFDLGSSGLLYDGTTIRAPLRTLLAWVTRTNVVDPERQSSSFEFRLMNKSRKKDIHPVLTRTRASVTKDDRDIVVEPCCCGYLKMLSMRTAYYGTMSSPEKLRLFDSLVRMNPYTAFKNLSCFFSDSDYTNGGMEKRNWVNAVIITENPGAQISSSIHPRSGKWYSSEQQCVQACEEMTERVRGILVLDPRGWTVEALLELRLYELKGLLWDRFGPRLCRDKRPYRLFSKPNFDEAMSRFALREFGEVVKPPNHQITKKSLAKVLSFAAKRYSPVQLCQSAGIPETVELELPPFVLDQGSSPTCTSNAIAAAVLMLQANKVAKIHALSGGTDDGLSIVKGLETFSTKMISPNDGFRYHYIENDIGKIRLALSQGMPCIVSIEDFKNVAEFDGKKKESKLIDQHAVVLYGYSDHENTFFGRNSWGAKWGDSGNFRISYANFRFVRDVYSLERW